MTSGLSPIFSPRDTVGILPRLGLRANWEQFTLLVLINTFVGGMVGLERTVVPLIGEQEFGLISKTAIVSFIVSFGLAKALCNLFAARLSETWGRKNVLVLGWLIGLPVPFIIIWANHWWWFDIANVLLGVNQALCWSMTVIMKVDLVGPRQRGLALGLNEFAGYLSVGGTAWLTGYLASLYSLRPEPFYLGIGFVTAGLLFSWLFAQETRGYALLEARHYTAVPAGTPAAPAHQDSLFPRGLCLDVLDKHNALVLQPENENAVMILIVLNYQEFPPPYTSPLRSLEHAKYPC